MNRPRRRVRPTWLFGLVVLAGTFLQVGCLFQSPPAAKTGDKKEGTSTPAAPVGVSCLGLADVETGVTGLAPLNPGRVVRVCVSETEEVNEGQPLLLMDDSQARLRVTEEEEAVKAAEVRVAQAEELNGQFADKIEQQRAAVEAAAQRVEAARWTRLHKKKLLDIGQMNDSEYQAFESQGRELEQLKAAEEARLREMKRHDPQLDVRRARAERAAARVRLEEAKINLAECVLKAPSKGRVLRLLVHRGDVITGAARQPAIQFCSDSPRVIRAELMQEYVGRVAKDDPVVVTDDVDLKTTWTGKVDRISDWYTQRRLYGDNPSQSKDVRTLECLVRLDSGQKELKIGQRVLVKISPRADAKPDDQ